MVAAGMGVTILSDMVYRPWSLEGQRLETRILEEEIPSMDIGLAWKRGREMSPETDAFAEFLRFAVTGVGHWKEAAAQGVQERPSIFEIPKPA